MHRKICILLFMSSILASCGGGNTSTTETSKTPKEEKTFICESNDIIYLSDFNNSLVSLEVKKVDGETVIVPSNELDFDLSEYNSCDKSNKTYVTVSSDEYKVSERLEFNIVPRKQYKILFIGNSFSEDLITYMKQISNDLGITSTIANLGIGGADIDTHISHIGNQLDDYNFQVVNDDGTIKLTQRVKADFGFGYSNWDFVSLQQNSRLSGQPSSYDRVESLVMNIYQKCEKLNVDPRFVWHMTWACQSDFTQEERFGPYDYDQMKMYNAICDSVKQKILPSPYFKSVLPSGTVIQNGRTSFVGDHFTRDGFHMSYSIGRFIIGLMAVKQLTNVDITKLSYHPSSVTELEMKMAVEAVNNAFKEPFRITDSTFKEGPKEEDYSKNPDYKQLDIKWNDGFYYSRTKSSSLINDPAAKNKFTATNILRRMDLPIGTAIKIEPGFSIRRNSWETLSSVYENREELSPSGTMIVDYSWWDKYKYFAFNVSKPDTSAVDNYDILHNALKIYVPKNPIDDGSDDPEYKDPFENMDVLKFDWIDGNYYSRTISSKLQNDPAAKNKFCCTPIFEKKDIPLGSIIVLKNGWRVIRHAWENLEKVYTDKENPYSSLQIKVDESWWGNYKYCAFNICTNSYSALPNFDEAHTAFTIYIPKVK